MNNSEHTINNSFTNWIIELTNKTSIVDLERTIVEAIQNLYSECEVTLYKTKKNRDNIGLNVVYSSAKCFEQRILLPKDDLITNSIKNHQPKKDGCVIYLPLSFHNNATEFLLKIAPKGQCMGLNCRAQQNEILSPSKIYQNLSALLLDKDSDSLTGLLNRKPFEGKVANILKQRSDTNHWLAIVDIDNFKKINDNYGHGVGDIILKELSEILKHTFRDNDEIFRFGGEEFVIILTDVDFVDTAQNIFERLKNNASKNTFSSALKITISLGFVEITPNTPINELVTQADQALYYAKNNGKNQICSFSALEKNEFICLTKK